MQSMATILHESTYTADHVFNGIICSYTIGDITISGGVVTLFMNTLTCISTGGPATTVT